MMQENAIALHSLVGVTWGKTQWPEGRTGVLGLPYELPGGHDHGFDLVPEGWGILMDHDGVERGGRACASLDAGHQEFVFDAAALPESVTPGRVIHVVLLYDPAIPEFLPRPIDGSTRVAQINLYLARPGEDARAVSEAFAGRTTAHDIMPLASILIGVALLWRR